MEALLTDNRSFLKNPKPFVEVYKSHIKEEEVKKTSTRLNKLMEKIKHTPPKQWECKKTIEKYIKQCDEKEEKFQKFIQTQTSIIT